MAVLGVRLDARARQFLGTALLCLHLGAAVCALGVLVVGLALAALFHRQRDVLQGFGHRRLTAAVVVVGASACVHHLLAARLSFYSGRPGRFAVPLLPVAALLLLVVSVWAAASVHRLTKGYEKGFLKLMEAYDADGTKRAEVDRLQVGNRCCGSTGYKNWLETDWHPVEFSRPELRGSKGRGVPFTCCDPEYMGPCPHDAGGRARPGYKRADAFHSEGCAAKVTSTVRWLLRQLSLWLLAPVLLQLLAALGTQYLRTSLLDAEGDGPGLGYLVRRCPCLAVLDGDFTDVFLKPGKGRE